MVSITGLSNNPVQKELLKKLQRIMDSELDDLYDIANWVAVLEKAAETIKAVNEDDQEGNGGVKFEVWVEHAKLDWRNWDSLTDQPKNA